MPVQRKSKNAPPGTVLLFPTEGLHINVIYYMYSLDLQDNLIMATYRLQATTGGIFVCISSPVHGATQRKSFVFSKSCMDDENQMNIDCTTSVSRLH